MLKTHLYSGIKSQDSEALGCTHQRTTQCWEISRHLQFTYNTYQSD